MHFEANIAASSPRFTSQQRACPSSGLTGMPPTPTCSSSHSPPERREVLTLLQALVEGLVEHAELVWVEELRTRERRVLEVHVSPSDLCRLLGPFGCTLQALRTALRRCMGPDEEGYQLNLIGDRQVWQAAEDSDEGLWEYPDWLSPPAASAEDTMKSPPTPATMAEEGEASAHHTGEGGRLQIEQDR